MDVAQKEKLAMPPELAARLALHSERNMRRCLLSMEACRVQQYPFKADQPVQVCDWEAYVTQIANEILQEQTPKRLLQVRGRFYELIVNCIPPSSSSSGWCANSTASWTWSSSTTAKHAAYFEHRMNEGSKAIIHMEAFVANFMAVYKKYLISSFG